MRSKVMAAGLLAAAMLVLLGAGPDKGRDVFNRRCTGCHALDEDKTGPRLRNVYGNKAASVAAFTYSDALRRSGLTWDESNLEKWLADPDVLVPDNNMPARVPSADERQAIITYLKGVRAGK